MFARETGGVARVGVFGGAFQLGIGLGLVSGSLLADAGADWRVGFFVSALAGVSALPLLRDERLRDHAGEQVAAGSWPWRVRTPRVYRLGTLFIAMFTVPLTLGAWLVHYLSVNGGMAVGVAGILSFLMFGASALFRTVGAELRLAGRLEAAAPRGHAAARDRRASR